MSEASTLAFEIGTEEIPAFDLVDATKQLETLARKAFDDNRIPYEDLAVYSTPRRLIIIAKAVADTTESLVEEYKGPTITVAFDEQGAPTKAGIGFAKGKGLEVADLERRMLDGVEYVYAVKEIPARATRDLLPEVLSKLIETISWPKSCCWGTEKAYFSRPVRWLLALLGTSVISVTFAGLTADRFTQGHRFLAPGPHTVESADDLLPLLSASYVVFDPKTREQLIRNRVTELEQETSYTAELPAKTLTEVINLTEYPTVLVGTFEEEFLRVPEEIIVDAMLMHQRYFPLYNNNQKLTDKFIIVSNGDPHYSPTIIEGNERVVRARLSDAKFFYEEDLKKPLEEYVERLDEVVFQETLGTMKDKTERIVKLAGHLANDLGLGADDTEAVLRTAYLSKADLVSNAVIEFTSVQGIMGSYYAKASGESDLVAMAIAEHYRPKFSGDNAPSTEVGKLVAIADKLDTICGLFAVGQAPTGSSDPFALRRNAIGIIHMLVNNLAISLEDAVKASLETYRSIAFDHDAIYNQVCEFFVTRTKMMLRDKGHAADVIDAILGAEVIEPSIIVARVGALESARSSSREVMGDLAIAYARANNLRDDSLGTEIDTDLMGQAETNLSDAINSVQENVSVALASNEYAQALESLAALRGPIDAFFEEVLIMDKDEAIKNNRLRLLNCFVAVFSPVADFGKMARSSKSSSR